MSATHFEARSYGGIRPATMRSRLVLELASELVGYRDFPEKQVEVSMRRQGSQTWSFCLFASDTPSQFEPVARGEVALGIVNPSSLLTVAYRGTKPFPERLPLRAITVMPSVDQFLIAVPANLGIRTLEDLPKLKPQLRVSLRGQRDHSVHWMFDHIAQASGFSVQDMLDWGCEISYDPGLPWADNRMGRIRTGELDTIIDEASDKWADEAINAGLALVSLSPQAMARLKVWGYKPARPDPRIKSDFGDDFLSLDFSGWAVYVAESAPDDLVESLCACIDLRKATIPWDGPGELPLAEMCGNTDSAPLEVPLHDAAARYWQSRGYL